MHRVVAGQVKIFKEEHELFYKDDKLFEAFSAYALSSIYCSEDIEPEDLVYEGADPGIDSLMIFSNEKHVTTLDEIKELFKGRKSDNEIKIVFVQSKSGEDWQKNI